MKKWYQETMQSGIEETMSTLQKSAVLKSFYLAGGTALALQIGHRKSFDLDFFSQDFDENVVEEKVKTINGFKLVKKETQTLHISIGKSKVSFLGYPYPLVFPYRFFNTVAIADVRDIAAMKMTAIANRGTKRDFFDLFTVAQLFSISELFEVFKSKFSKVNYSKNHVLRSLTYFNDAEDDVELKMLNNTSWQEVKAFFIKEVPKLS
ncbi:MAG: nucleotidyl transferase AbiEii/AbiGii toxin family protein [Blastocatellia bacterium]